MLLGRLRWNVRVGQFFNSAAGRLTNSKRKFGNFPPHKIASNAKERQEEQITPIWQVRRHFCSSQNAAISTDNPTTTTTTTAEDEHPEMEGEKGVATQSSSAKAGEEMSSTAGNGVEEDAMEKVKRDGKAEGGTTAIASDHADLAKKSLRLDESGKGYLSIHMQRGRSGMKFFNIKKYINGQFIDFPNIRVPEDAYPFVRAMDGIFEALSSKEHSNFSKNRRHLLHTTRATGIRYEFEFDLGWLGDYFAVDMHSCKKVDDERGRKERTLFLSIREFHWLRHQIGEMLAEHDGSQKLDAPPRFPGEWLLMDGRPRSLVQQRQSPPLQSTSSPSPAPPQPSPANPVGPGGGSNAAQQHQMQTTAQLLAQQLQHLQKQTAMGAGGMILPQQQAAIQQSAQLANVLAQLLQMQMAQQPHNAAAEPQLQQAQQSQPHNPVLAGRGQQQRRGAGPIGGNYNRNSNQGGGTRKGRF